MTDDWLEFETTDDDIRLFARFVDQQRHHRRTHSRLGRGALTVIGVLVALFLALAALLTAVEGTLAWTQVILGDPLVRKLTLALVIVASLLVLFRLAVPYLAVWAAKRSRHVLGDRRLRLTDLEVEVVGEHLESKIAWSGLGAIHEANDAFYLMMSPDGGVVVPWRAFDTAQIEAFRATVKRRPVEQSAPTPPPTRAS
jgi:YcxB-like protein